MQIQCRPEPSEPQYTRNTRHAGRIHAFELTNICVCSEMCQCTLRRISVYELSLCLEV